MPTDSVTDAPATEPVDNQSPESILADLEAPPAPVAQAPPALDDAFVKRLGGIDPKDLPEDLRRKLELPFKQDHTKKTQDLAEERKRVESMVERLAGTVEKLAANQGGAQTVTADEREILKQKIAEGDTDAITAYMDKLFADKVDNDPRMLNLTQTQAIQEAARLMPEIGQYEQEVAAALRADPVLLQMATMNKLSFTPKVLAGLAYQAAFNKQKAHIAGEPERMKEYGRKVLEAYKAKVRGAPSITTRAGRTEGDNGKDADYLPSFKELATEEWESGRHNR